VGIVLARDGIHEFLTDPPGRFCAGHGRYDKECNCLIELTSDFEGIDSHLELFECLVEGQLHYWRSATRQLQERLKDGPAPEGDKLAGRIWAGMDAGAPKGGDAAAPLEVPAR